MATKAEVRNRALQALGVIAIGATPESQDTTRVEDGFDEVYGALKDEGLVTWASTAEVPTKIVPYMVAMVAWNCVNDYGVSPARYQRLAAEAAPPPLGTDAAKKQIRELTAAQYEAIEDMTDY